MVSRSQLQSRGLQQSQRNLSLQQRTQINEQKRQQQVAQQKAQQEQQRIQDEVQKFQNDLTYSNYESKYNSLSPEAKALVADPNKIKTSPEYKQWREAQQKIQQATEYNSALQRVKKAVGQGKLWAYLGFGSDLEKSIAEQFKQGGAPVAMGKLYEEQLKSVELPSVQVGGMTDKVTVPQVKTVTVPQYDTEGKFVQYVTKEVVSKPSEYQVALQYSGKVKPQPSPVREIVTQSESTLESVQVPVVKGEYTTPIIQLPTSSLGLPATNQLTRDIMNIQQNKKDFIKSETQRYQNLGYSQYQSQKLAQKSYEMGGASVLPEYTKYTIPIKKLGKNILSTGVSFIESEPVKTITDIPVGRPQIGGLDLPGSRYDISPLYSIGEERTLGQTLASPAETLSFTGKAIGKGAAEFKEFSYEVPVLKQLSKAEDVFMEKKKEQLQPFFRQDSKVLSTLFPTTPEEYGRRAEIGVELGSYFTPAAPYLIGSSAFRGIETTKGAEKIAEKELKKEAEDYVEVVKKNYDEALLTIPEGYELEPIPSDRELTEEYIAKNLPERIEQVKKRGASEFLFSTGTLGVMGGAKAFGEFAPRTKYGGLSKSGYKKALTETEKQFKLLGEQPVKFVSKIESKGGKVDLFGQQTLVSDKAGKIYKESFKGSLPKDLNVLQRDITISGFLKKTETGKMFIPETKGTSIIKGTILEPKGKSVSYLGTEIFETGSKVGTRYIKNIGDIQKYEFISKGGAYPKASTFALYKESNLFFRSKTITKQFKKNIQFGGTPILNINTGNLYKFTPSQTEEMFGPEFLESYLTASKTGVGTTLIKRPPKLSGIKVFKGGGKKTPFSITFPEEIPKPQPSLNAFDIQTRILPSETKPILDTSLVINPVVTKPKIPESIILKTDISRIAMTGLTVKEIGTSPFYGTGQYERTFDTGLIIPGKILPVFENVLTKNFEIIPQKISQPQIVSQKIEQRVINVPKQISRQLIVPKVGTQEVQIPRTFQQSNQMSRQIQRGRLNLRQQQKYVQSQFIPQIVTPFGINVPRIRTPRIPIIKKSRIRQQRIPFLVQKESQTPFTFQYKKRGKVLTSPFAFRTEKEAEAYAKQFALQSAVASIKPIKAIAGQRIIKSPFSINPKTNLLFRKGKGGFIVQKERLRILSPGEKRETSYAGAKVRKSKKSPRKSKIKSRIKSKK